jgi:hypothetical protein
MTAATGNEWDEIARTWGHAYTLSHDPAAAPGRRYSARPLGAGDTLHAETPARLLDAIKDHAAAHLFPEARQ